MVRIPLTDHSIKELEYLFLLLKIPKVMESVNLSSIFLTWKVIISTKVLKIFCTYFAAAD